MKVLVSCSPTSHSDCCLFCNFLFPLSFPPGFAIYFFYGIKNSSEAAKRSSPRKYEPALQTKSPIYKGAPDDSDVEAGSSP